MRGWTPPTPVIPEEQMANSLPKVQSQHYSLRSLAHKLREPGERGGQILITGNYPRSAVRFSDLPSDSKANEALEAAGIKPPTYSENSTEAKSRTCAHRFGQTFRRRHLLMQEGLGSMLISSESLSNRAMCVEKMRSTSTKKSI